jgi:hypothetical protein
MRQKFMTVILSAVLCLGMSITAMASQSPSGSVPTSNSVTVASTSSDVYASATTAQTKALDAFYAKIAVSSSATDAEATAARNTAYQTFIQEQINTSVTVEFGNILDVTAADLSKPVRFAAPGITAGDSIVVLHLKADGTWEKISATAGNGYIDGSFTSLSPVLYAKIAASYSPEYYEQLKADYEAGQAAAAAKETAEQETANAETTTTSPKTADSNMTMIVVLLGAGMVAGAVVVSRRKFHA